MSDMNGTAFASHVARLFFDRQMTKVEIAARLGISRYRVARLVDQALAQGLVHIEFRDVPEQDREVAAAIEETWAIDLCAVANVDSADDPLRALARLAASIVDDLVVGGAVVGIAWGSTLAAVARELPRREDPSLTVVQLAGSSTRVEPERASGELARRVADRLGAKYVPLFAPAFVKSTALRDALLREPEIAAAAELWSRLDVAIVGIGAMPRTGDPSEARSSLLQSGVLSSADLGAIRAAGACGDLVLYPFDVSGSFVAHEIAQRSIAIPLALLDTVPRVVAVAGGEDKSDAIRGALETGMIDVLVTDSAAATAVAREAGLRTSRRTGRPTSRAGRSA